MVLSCGCCAESAALTNTCLLDPSSTAEEALEVAGKAAAEDLAAAADMAAVRRGGKPALTRLKSPRAI